MWRIAGCLIAFVWGAFLLSGIVACQTDDGPNSSLGGGYQVPWTSDRSDFTYREHYRSPQNSTPHSGIWDSSPSSTEMPAMDAGAHAPGAPDAGEEPGGTPPPSGRQDAVEEGELSRIFGQTLYYLNTYKGLTLISLADPKQPKKIANLPVFGAPIEMFFDKDRAYVLVKETLYLKKDKGTFRFVRRYVSQLVIVDIANLQAPKILQRWDIEGILREGVSRKVGSILYVVSSRPRDYVPSGWSRSGENVQERATVYSFDVADPQKIRQVQSLELIDPSRIPQNQPNSGNYSFNGITISATSNALLVGERWSYYSYTREKQGCARGESYNTTVLNLIDISDPTGIIRVHTRFPIRGVLSDQFKQSYAYDAQTKRGVYYGIFQRNEWDTNCDGKMFVKNTFLSVDISDGTKPKVLSELVFGKLDEIVRGTLFDHNRKVVFAITAVVTSPFYVLSFADPNKLEVRNVIDGLSGDVSVFRLLGNGDFLMGIGSDQTGHCTGFEQWVDRHATKAAVSIFDVRNLDKARLVQRRCVSVLLGRATFLNEWDLNQAHKMVSLFSDGTLNAVSVPVSYYSSNCFNDRWWFDYQTAIGLMGWDLSKYDETKDETQQKVLEDLGTIVHPYGEVRRTIIFRMEHNGTSRRYVLNLSSTHLSLVDFQNPAQPQLLSTLELTPFVNGIFRVGDAFIEHLSDTPHSKENTWNALKVRKLGPGPVDQLPVLDTFYLGNVSWIKQWGSILVVAQFPLELENSQKMGTPIYSPRQEIMLIDFRDPAKPRVRGSLVLDSPIFLFDPSRNSTQIQTLGYPNRLSSSNNWSLTDRGLLVFVSTPSNGKPFRLLELDFRQPERPLARDIPLDIPNSLGMENGEPLVWYGLVAQDANCIYLTYRILVNKVPAGDWSHYDYKFFAQRLQRRGEQWQQTQKINLPGRLLWAFPYKGQTLFITRDNAYPLGSFEKLNFTHVRTRLFALRERSDGRAEVMASQLFADSYPTTIARHGAQLFMMTTLYPFNTSKTGNEGAIFWSIQLTDNAFHVLYQQPTQLPWVDIFGVLGSRLLFQIGSDEGLLAADLSDPTKPKATHFAPIQGWMQDVILGQGEILASAGYYGVLRLDFKQLDMP